ncbi:neurexin 3a isoform X18 [Tachysurus ichikawai]
MRPCRAERRPTGGSVSFTVSTSRVWMWSLTLGCIAGSVWSSSSSTRYIGNSVPPAARPAASTSYVYSERDPHILHSAPVSIYRSSASLRSGHGESLTLNLHEAESLMPLSVHQSLSSVLS